MNILTLSLSLTHLLSLSLCRLSSAPPLLLLALSRLNSEISAFLLPSRPITGHACLQVTAASTTAASPPVEMYNLVRWSFLLPPLSSQHCTRCASNFFLIARPLPFVGHHLSVCVMFLLHLHFNDDFFPHASVILYLSRLY